MAEGTLYSLVPKLFYSTASIGDSIGNAEGAKSQSISHVLLVGDGDAKKLSSFQVTQLQTEESALLSKFPMFHEKISIGIQAGGMWVIGTNAATTAAILISFLMTSLSKSFSLVKAKKYFEEISPVSLTPSIEEQLQIWSNMNATIDTKHPDWANYQRTNKISHEDLLRSLLAQTSKKTTRYAFATKRPASMIEITPRSPRDRSGTGSAVDVLAKNWRLKKLEWNSLPSPGIGSWGYVCSNCNKKLFSEENIIPHGPSKNEQPECTFICIEPLRWMGSDVTSKKGTIKCYNCKTPLGQFNWKRFSSCSCKQKLKATFAISRDKITFIAKPEEPKKELLLSPRATKKKSKLSGIKATFNLRSSNSISIQKDLPSVPKDKKDSKSQVYPVCFARNFDELPKNLQKYITKAKLDIDTVNANWYAAIQVFRFTAKARVIPLPEPPEDERDSLIKRYKNREFNRLNCAHYGVEILAKGSTYENLLEEYAEPPPLPDLSMDEDEEDDDEEKSEDLETHETPIAPRGEAYITKVLGEVKTSPLGFTPPNDPDYFETMQKKYITPQNPKDTLKILEKAGKGGFGSVFVAREIKIKRGKNQVAVKKMPHSSKKEKLSNFRELEFLVKCQHENIVQYSRSYLQNDEIWLVMEYMEGGSLKEASSSFTFQEPHIAYIARETLKALEYMHNLGLVHRDLKPGNIMLTTKGVVKLIDFGLCDEIERVVRNPRMVGSPYWMPPEIILKAPYNEKVDVWSLGVTLLQLIDKKGYEYGTPFSALFKTSTIGRVNPFSSNNYSSDLQSFIQAMLTRDVKERPSVSELLQHKFLKVSDTRRNMEKIISQIFISNVVGIPGI